MDVTEFHYHLPESAIAQEPVEPRHDSRLLDTRDMNDHRFLDLADLLEPGDLLVVNETKVRAARLQGHRAGTGGSVELMLLDRDRDGNWTALARPSRRLRPGVVIEFGEFSATVISAPRQGMVLVELDAEDPEIAIEKVGTVPLPPYFHGTLDNPERYQTIFATTPGSAAAPTAGLHFTDQVLERLGQRGVEMASVDLHVSVDTFRPISTQRVEDHQMHTEWCTVPEETATAVGNTRARGRSIVAVGTTVARTLETFADGMGGVEPGEKETDLFLRPGSVFSVVDALVTNFHLPRSTLLVMLAGFMGPAWKDAYVTALQRGYRFLSFGDAMYAERSST